ncbi:MAG: diguanylate cyclase [Deltaproteobacteria bacterium]|nr:diguanylate cyclase [Deltaproteobacteria bacterium]
MEPDQPNLIRELLDVIRRALISTAWQSFSPAEIHALALSALSQANPGGLSALLVCEADPKQLRLALASDSLPCPVETIEELDLYAADLEAAVRQCLGPGCAERALFVKRLESSGRPSGLLFLLAAPGASLDERQREALRALSTTVQEMLTVADLLAHMLDRVLLDVETGVFNAAYARGRLRAELARASRHGHPMSFLLVALDAGQEAALRDTLALGELLRSGPRADRPGFAFRTSDVCARLGLDLYAIILPETPKWGALTKAERLRKASSDRALAVSIGVAAFPEDAADARGIFEAAEQALSKAQAGGGRRVEAAG